MTLKTFSMADGDLKVTLRFDNANAIVSVLFDGELIDQYEINSPNSPEAYIASLIESFKVILREAAMVPDLTPIDSE